MEIVFNLLENKIFPICLITMISVILLVVIFGFIALVMNGCDEYDKATDKLKKLREEISSYEDKKQCLLESIEDLRSQFYILESKISQCKVNKKKK